MIHRGCFVIQSKPCCIFRTQFCFLVRWKWILILKNALPIATCGRLLTGRISSLSSQNKQDNYTWSAVREVLTWGNLKKKKNAENKSKVKVDRANSIIHTFFGCLFSRWYNSRDFILCCTITFCHTQSPVMINKEHGSLPHHIALTLTAHITCLGHSISSILI